MTLSFVLGALVAAAICQPTAERFIAAAGFVAAAWIHELFFSHLEGFAYHGTAAVGALAVMIMISRIIIPSPMIISIHRICIVSILMNFMGWVAWRAYLPPDPYNVAMLVVFIWALITLSRKEPTHGVGRDTVGWWGADFRINTIAGFQLLPIHGAKS
jgi:hypothetical protein